MMGTALFPIQREGMERIHNYSGRYHGVNANFKLRFYNYYRGISRIPEKENETNTTRS
jgi:hypothetical protein